MAYKGNWATGDLIDATAFQELVNSAIYSFADLSTIQSSISSPVDGQIAYAQDTEIYYRYDSDSTSWVLAFDTGDINSVTVTTASGSGLSGGATASSGDFTATLVIDINGQSSVTATVSDEMLISDVSGSNAIKKITLNDLPISSATQTALDNITAGTTAIRTDIAVTVADNGSGSQNEYFLEGSQDQVINVTTGFKYRFDQSDNSNTGHPLRFSTTKDGSHSSGSEFTDNVTTNGTPGSAGSYTQIEVKADTPERLYIYCTSHSGMGGDTQLTAGGFSVDGGTVRGDTDFSDKEVTKFVAKDYAEDVATTSDSGT